MLLRRLFSILLLLLTLSIMEVSAQQYLEFIENKGQWPSAIKFQAQTVAGAFALQNNGYRVLVHDPQDLAALNTHTLAKKIMLQQHQKILTASCIHMHMK